MVAALLEINANQYLFFAPGTTYCPREVVLRAVIDLREAEIQADSSFQARRRMTCLLDSVDGTRDAERLEDKAECCFDVKG